MSGRLIFEGLNDTLRVAQDARLETSHDNTVMPFFKLREDMDTALFINPQSFSDIRHHLDLLSSSAGRLNAEFKALDRGALKPFGVWLDDFGKQCQNALDDLPQLVPWLDKPCSRETTGLDDMMTLRQLAGFDLSLIPSNGSDRTQLRSLVQAGIQAARLHLERIDTMIEQCTSFSRIEYDFLYDEARHLLAIGYNLDDGRRDGGYYDLLERVDVRIPHADL